MKEILLNFQIPVHGREPTEELIDKIEKLLRKRKFIICLDEVDQLNNFDILYTLARNGFGLILASTYYHALMYLPSRIKSSLALTEIEFPAYKPDELFDILRDRVQFSFKPNSLKDELIKIVSVMAEGKKAEDKNLRKVTIEEIKQSAKEAKRFKTSYSTSKLNEHQKIIYEILCKKKKMSSGLP